MASIYTDVARDLATRWETMGKKVLEGTDGPPLSEDYRNGINAGLRQAAANLRGLADLVDEDSSTTTTE